LERRRLKGEIHALVSPELERRGFLAAFSERTGGVSPEPFASLNLGPDTGDDPGLVDENRARFAEAVGIDQLHSVRQVHGTRLQRVESRVPVGPTVDADGLTTTSKRVPLAIMVADCVPLALASEQEDTLACVHVGWRGLATGIVQEALGSFSEVSGVAAAVGPSIGPCHYEVGPDVLAAVQAGTEGLAVSHDGSRPRLDLSRTVEAVLDRAGVSRVDRAGECTACEPARFFSHRRDRRTGRQALVAMQV
jgi:YfiH family protein